MNDEGVCKTAPATRGLLNIYLGIRVQIILSCNTHNTKVTPPAPELLRSQLILSGLGSFIASVTLGHYFYTNSRNIYGSKLQERKFCDKRVKFS